MLYYSSRFVREGVMERGSDGFCWSSCMIAGR